MNLHEAPEFRDALIAAARVRGVSEQFVEKDYYVTEALRVVQRELPTQAVFKGGTSLSKG